MDFSDLKKMTFKDIFKCSNKEANSIKKPINYVNYTKENHDILSKKERANVFRDFDSVHCHEYTELKPPPFDMQQHLKEMKKREKASLDKTPKKYIIKNIKTCSSFART